MRLERGSGWLTYCLNVHPSETWAEARAALLGPVRAVKAALSPDRPFAVGLRFSAAAVADLAAPDARGELKDLLDAQGYAAVTVNGFPHGRFRETRVKEAVYLPDWRDEARLAYTEALADLMGDLAPEGETVSLSTVPGAFKPRGAGFEAAMADRMLRAVAHLVALERCTGRTVALALEPEPCCLLETVAEAVAFFEAHLFGAAAERRLGGLAGLSAAAAATALRRHLGLCYDVCHAAVEFEDPHASIEALRRAGVSIHKLQLSAALSLPEATAGARAALAAFDEPTYLHQVVSRGRNDVLRREADLPAALARGGAADGEAWRVHFHVPVFVGAVGGLATTQDFLAEILAIHAREPVAPHLEVETYTWGVLPPALRTETIEAGVIREMGWVLERLGDRLGP